MRLLTEETLLQIMVLEIVFLVVYFILTLHQKEQVF